MKDGALKKVARVTAAMLVTTSVGVAQAQQPAAQRAPAVQQALPYGAASTAYYGEAQQSSNDELAALRTRLDRYEAELAQVRAERQAQTDKLASFDLADGDKKGGDKPKDPPGPKKVAIIDKPTFKVGVKIFADEVVYDQDAASLAQLGDIQDYTGFRLLRLQASGDLYENIDYVVEIDLAGNLFPGGANFQQTAFKDVYMTIKNLPYGNVRVGHFKEPIGMETLTSDSVTTFLERSAPGDTFTPSRRIGIMNYNYIADDQDYSYYVGAFREGFRDTQVIERSDLGDWGITGRLAACPYYDEPGEGRCLVHFGAAAEWTGTNNGNNTEARTFTTNPETRPGSFTAAIPTLSTGALPVDEFSLIGFEAAWQNGPLSVTGEYFGCNADAINPALGSEYFEGFYVEAAYFLTGEHRGYDRELKRWSRVKPWEPFFKVQTCDGVCCGLGAWQVAARYSYVDTSNAPFIGGAAATSGIQNNYTAGLNWYLNTNVRVMWNVIHTDLSRNAQADTELDTVAMRIQWDF